ncbi:CGNR zinc finger domain-containing protein [Clostridiaceae bacterium M8S5]|nr:CGNR zinc finger domain-containing protein [Clostridiaceae bacterium M8S5]
MIENLVILGERLCLDFVNTIENHLNESMYIERFTSYNNFVKWCTRVNILDIDVANHLTKKGNENNIESSNVLKRAIVLREALFKIFLAVISNNTPKQSDIEVLNSEINKTMAFSQLKYKNNTFVWEKNHTNDLDCMFSFIVKDAVSLLTSDKLDRLKLCDDACCGWLFLDMSKNKSRKWCSMKYCGNRAKARKHYKNKKT